MVSYNYTEAKTLIKAEGLKLTLGGNKIIDGLDLEIKDIIQEGMTRGQVRSIVGPSGVGKTQLMRLLTGLKTPDDGSVTISPHGSDAMETVKPGMVGIVAQNYPLFEHLTLMDNLILAAKISGLKEKGAKEKALSMLENFSLYEHRHKWPGKLSGGQRQRGAILQQILVDRKYLMLDEPFSGLDPASLNKVLNLIIEITTADEFNTIIIITHDISAALRVSDHIHILGRKFDENKNIIRAGHIVESINLVDAGIAWRPHIRTLPKYQEVMHRIEQMFVDSKL